MKILVSNLKQVPRSSSKICRNCFSICCTAEVYGRHIETCMQNKAAFIKLPDETKNDLHIRNYQSRWFAPYVMYFDFETLIRPAATCYHTSDRSSRDIIERHEPCGFCLVVIEHNNPEPVFFKLERSSNFIQRFVENLKTCKRLLRNEAITSSVHRSPHFPSDQCWVCERGLAESERVLDHCHASGKFLGFAHSKCNLKRRTVNYIPLLAHNLSYCDLHFVCKSRHLFPEDSKIQVIPITDEKYISLLIDLRVASYTDRRGVEKYIYDFLRFVDSFRFIASSLDKLVSYTPAANFSLLENTFLNIVPNTCNFSIKRDFTPTLSIHIRNFRKNPCPV